jgi:hypothetical protein
VAQKQTRTQGEVLKLTINIATRGRPELLKETIERTLPNITNPSTVLMVSIDEDDAKTTTISSWMGPKALLDKRVRCSIKPREDSRGEKYDRALTEAPADVYMPAVDFAPIVTPGFDQMILDKAKLFPDGIGVVRTPYINGVFPPGLQAVTAGWVEKVGYIYSHDYPFWYIDHEVHDVARLIGRYFEVPVKVETQEMRQSKTIRLRDLVFWCNYYDLMALERRALARSIIDGFDCPEHVKEHLRQNYHGIEHEARTINDGVRKNAAAIEAQRGDSGPPDEGYLRAKARAEQKLSRYLEAIKAAA